MKKTMKMVALILALFMMTAFVMTACNRDCGEGNHVDADHNAVCDVCGKEGLSVTHTGGTATCTAKAVCSVCGVAYGELAAHTGGTATCQAKATCTVCNQAYGNLASHVDDDHDGLCDVCFGDMGNFVLYSSEGNIWAVTGSGHEDEKYYTYNSYSGGFSSLNWNPHTWEENMDSTVLGYVTTGLFEYVLNEAGNGYVIVPELATYVPGTERGLFQDVTYAYYGELGVKEGDTAKAFRIYLNPNATWDDAANTPITGADYVYSLQEQLNPAMMNRRADSYYGGAFSIYGAKKYLYSTTDIVYTPLVDLGYKTNAEGIEALGAENVYYSIAVWNNAFGWNIAGYVDEEGNPIPEYVSIADETVYDAPEAWAGTGASDPFQAKYYYEAYIPYGYWEIGAGYESYGFVLTLAQENADLGYSFDNVGWKVGVDPVSGLEYIDMIIEESLYLPEFYVPYYASAPLVKQDLYEANKIYHYADGTTSKGSIKDGLTMDDVVSITSEYNTRLDNCIGYGPYKLSYYELDKQLTFVRNENWYGYSDGKHVGQYQTDKVSIEVIKEHNTAMLAFEQGKLDGIGLDSADMEKYGNSSKIIYTPETYTTKVTFNTDYAKLAAREDDGINKTMLTVREFREAFSLSIDRQTFVSSYTASAGVGFGLLNYMYVFDPASGIAYRATDAGKKAIVDLYGIEYGAGEDYATLDEAYEAVTGYNPEKAKTLFQEAYDYATTHDKLGNEVDFGSADAIYNGTDTVSIQFSVYSSDDIYTQMFNFFKKALEDACKDTDLEGKVTMTMVADPDYYDTLYAGETDLIFSTWGGAQFNGLGMLGNVYCDDPSGQGNQMEVGFDTSTISLTIKLDVEGTLEYKEFTTSLKNWADWLNGTLDLEKTPIKSSDGTVTLDKYQAYSTAILTEVFAAAERCYMSYYTAIPIYYRNGASLDSFKINNAVDEYVALVGFGGLRFTTYNYDDAAWSNYISNNTLDYTK